MIAQPKIIQPQEEVSFLYDHDFLDDVLGIFEDQRGYAPKAGGVGKYIYGKGNWGHILEHSASYYVPRGDQELIESALQDMGSWSIPEQTPYIDFGVGGAMSFERNALPIMRKLALHDYTGVDFCHSFLEEIKALVSPPQNISIKTEILDFFFPTNKILSKKKPALGVMNGLTLGNIYGLVKGADVRTNLIVALKYLSQLCGHGWLLLTIDTNQNETSLRNAYCIPSIESIFLSIFERMKRELPTEGFNPSSFTYTPEFSIDTQAWMHKATATENQNFMLEDYHVSVVKGQKIHLGTSYKWRREFFEDCCNAAHLSVQKALSHETGMMLYLLKDRANPVI